MDAATFLARYPEFASITVPSPGTVSGTVQTELDEADAILSLSAFGALRDMAMRLVAAHRLALRFNVNSPGVRNPGQPGVNTSQSASTSGLSKGMALNAAVTGDQNWRADFGRTAYGLQYLSLVDGTITPALLTGQAEPDGGGANELFPLQTPVAPL